MRDESKSANYNKNVVLKLLEKTPKKGREKTILKMITDAFWRKARVSIRSPGWWRMLLLQSQNCVFVVVATRRRHSAGPVGGNRLTTSSVH